MNGWLATLLFFLPAGIANATPVFANKVPVVKNWRTPLDLGMTWRGQRLLGPNKTWRGVCTGSLLAGVTALALSPFVHFANGLPATFGLGVIMGFGALCGDAVESALKRQRGIPSGNRWFPFDQIDYIIGGLVFLIPFAHLTKADVLFIFVAFFGLHLASAYVGYLLGLKDKPI